MSSNSKRAGVLLVGHGTRDEIGTQQFFQLGSLLEKQLAPTPTVACLLEFQEPTIPQAWDQLVAKGIDHIHVAPLLLFAAGHAKQDIPDRVRECQSKTPHISYDQAGPLSRHDAIIELLLQRIESVSATLDQKSTALVMVGRGSHDPCAQADMRILTQLIAHRRSFSLAETAFYAMAKPQLPEVLDQFASQPETKDVVVQPHLLFDGRLYQAIEKQAAEASQRHSETQFHVGNYLGPMSQIAKAICDRIRS